MLAAEKLFYEENTFKLVVYIQAGCLGVFIVGGVIWEFFVRNKPTGNNSTEIRPTHYAGSEKSDKLSVSATIE